MIQILVVDDHAVLRDGIRSILDPNLICESWRSCSGDGGIEESRRM